MARVTNATTAWVLTHYYDEQIMSTYAIQTFTGCRAHVVVELVFPSNGKFLRNQLLTVNDDAYLGDGGGRGASHGGDSDSNFSDAGSVVSAVSAATGSHIQRHDSSTSGRLRGGHRATPPRRRRSYNLSLTARVALAGESMHEARALKAQQRTQTRTPSSYHFDLHGVTSSSGGGGGRGGANPRLRASSEEVANSDSDAIDRRQSAKARLSSAARGGPAASSPSQRSTPKRGKSYWKGEGGAEDPGQASPLLMEVDADEGGDSKEGVEAPSGITVEPPALPALPAQPRSTKVLRPQQSSYGAWSSDEDLSESEEEEGTRRAAKQGHVSTKEFFNLKSFAAGLGHAVGTTCKGGVLLTHTCMSLQAPSFHRE